MSPIILAVGANVPTYLRIKNGNITEVTPEKLQMSPYFSMVWVICPHFSKALAEHCPRGLEGLELRASGHWKCNGFLVKLYMEINGPLKIGELVIYFYGGFEWSSKISTESLEGSINGSHYKTWLLYPPGQAYHLIKFWWKSFFLFFYLFFKISDVFFSKSNTPLVISILGMVRAIDMKQKGSASVGYWVNYVT